MVPTGKEMVTIDRTCGGAVPDPPPQPVVIERLIRRLVQSATPKIPPVFSIFIVASTSQRGYANSRASQLEFLLGEISFTNTVSPGSVDFPDTAPFALTYCPWLNVPPSVPRSVMVYDVGLLLA